MTQQVGFGSLAHNTCRGRTLDNMLVVQCTMYTVQGNTTAVSKNALYQTPTVVKNTADRSVYNLQRVMKQITVITHFRR